MSDRNQSKKDHLSITTICFPHLHTGCSCCTQSHRTVQAKQQMKNWGEEKTKKGYRSRKETIKKYLWQTERLSNLERKKILKDVGNIRVQNILARKKKKPERDNVCKQEFGNAWKLGKKWVLEKRIYNWEWKRKHIDKIEVTRTEESQERKLKRASCKYIQKMQKSSGREKNNNSYIKKNNWFFIQNNINVALYSRISLKKTQLQMLQSLLMFSFYQKFYSRHMYTIFSLILSPFVQCNICL